MGGAYKLDGKFVAGFSRNADDIIFDPTGTDLTSTDVDGAIKEIDSKLTNVSSTLANKIVDKNGNTLKAISINAVTSSSQFTLAQLGLTSVYAIYCCPYDVGTYQIVCSGYVSNDEVRFKAKYWTGTGWNDTSQMFGALIVGS